MNTTRGRDLLDDMMQSDDWDAFKGDRMGGLAYNDPDRCTRVYDAAEHGADGSTHAECIRDMRDGAESYFRWNHDPTLWNCLEAVNAELDIIEAWHYEAGTLHQEVG